MLKVACNFATFKNEPHDQSCLQLRNFQKRDPWSKLLATSQLSKTSTMVKVACNFATFKNDPHAQSCMQLRNFQNDPMLKFACNFATFKNEPHAQSCLQLRNFRKLAPWSKLLATSQLFNTVSREHKIRPIINVLYMNRKISNFRS